MSISPLSINEIPSSLLSEFEALKSSFLENNIEYSDWFIDRCADDEFLVMLVRAWIGSRYAFNVCMQRPALFKLLVDENILQKNYADGDLAAVVEAALADIEEGKQFDQQLRRCRQQEMLRIIWRDLNRLSDMRETTADISALADVAIQQTTNFHHRQLAQQYGVPCANVDGVKVEQSMVILGMGKLGAHELNLSSDIDLIFAYPQSGETVAPQDSSIKKTLDNQQFFTRLGQRVIASLDAATADGFVFRVDMRLRPYGDSGALVLSFDAMEEYYQDQGRDWERYAMIKARAVYGDTDQCEELMTMLRPFVFRRYIDFSVIDSLRSMKKMIRQEVIRRGLQNDVKLGAGGIREVEFIAQCFQLIRGGREAPLQQRSLLAVLSELEQREYLSSQAVNELVEAYYFLRNTEHALQGFDDKQTQALPVDSYPQSVLAMVMGFSCWEDFCLALAAHRDNVAEHFQAVIADADDAEEDEALSDDWSHIWLDILDQQEALGVLQREGYEAAEDVLARLERLKRESVVQRMQPVGRERLDQFMPLLLALAADVERPSETVLRIFPLIESVLRRTAYLVLLTENPTALQRLVTFCAASPWIAAQLARHPVLLDELLDSRTLFAVPDKQDLVSELQQQMLRIPWDDLEAHMDGLRYFKQAHQLRVSVAEVTNQLELMKVSDYLTLLAEVILEHVVDVAWHYMIDRHGRPQNSLSDTANEPFSDERKGFIVVGYGKMGGIELGHGSDLDLVFIYDADPNGVTNGDRALANSVFFTRLGQRMIHILTAQTPMGDLYEVDMRLRPSGESGMLVTTLTAFEQYQRESAWTWEHQALVRARAVAGDDELAQRFEQLRCDLLCLSRDTEALKQEVGQMREKMRDHLLPKGLESADPPIFHLKHGTGAIVDIEFMVQYAVLAWSHQYPALAVYTDNIRILQALQQQQLFSEADAQALIDAYKAYRSHTHRLSLQQQPNQVLMSEYTSQRQLVSSKWLQLMG
jgi:glutamate-ammonia-ligase adenylyltransferase